jgi:hypothetical protein
MRCHWRILALALVLVAGCAQQPDGMLADYRARVQRASGVDVQRPPAFVPPVYPSHRERAIPIPEVRGSVWELLIDLPDCELDHLVSERNSILGRYWPATSRFDYELRFRAGLDTCRARFAHAAQVDPTQREFLARLDEIAAAKREVLPALWWALTYDSAEFEQAFSPASAPLHAGERGVDAVAALDLLLGLSSRLAASEAGIELAPLDRALGRLAASRYGGSLLRSLGMLIRELDAATTALQTAYAAPVCPQQRPTPRARVLHRVFTDYYAARVQPYLADVQTGGRAWLGAHARLLSSQRVEPPAAFARFSKFALDDGDGSLWQGWINARDRHVRAWQQMLGQCGLMPGAQ